MLSFCRPGFGVTLNKEGLERPYTRSQKQVRTANPLLARSLTKDINKMTSRMHKLYLNSPSLNTNIA